MILSTAWSPLYSGQLFCTSPVRAMKGWPDLEGHLSCVKASKPNSYCCFPVQHHSSSDAPQHQEMVNQSGGFPSREKTQWKNSNLGKGDQLAAGVYKACSQGEAVWEQ